MVSSSHCKCCLGNFQTAATHAAGLLSWLDVKDTENLRGNIRKTVDAELVNRYLVLSVFISYPNEPLLILVESIMLSGYTILFMVSRASSTILHLRISRSMRGAQTRNKWPRRCMNGITMS